MTPAEVAEVLRVTPRTIRRWANEGRIARVHLGGRLTRYRDRDVAALINDDGTAANGPVEKKGITSAHPEQY